MRFTDHKKLKMCTVDGNFIWMVNFQQIIISIYNFVSPLLKKLVDLDYHFVIQQTRR